MQVGDKLWKNCNKARLKLWQTQLNFAVWCASSACRVRAFKLQKVRSLYRFHVYYHVGRILKRLQVPLPHGGGFNSANNPYTNEEFLKICKDYKVPHCSFQIFTHGYLIQQVSYRQQINRKHRCCNTILMSVH